MVNLIYKKRKKRNGWGKFNLKHGKIIPSHNQKEISQKNIVVA